MAKVGIRFKYGSTWQFYYHIGDTLKWGGNDYGSPDLKSVKAYGIIESTDCPFCGKANIDEEYDILIKDSIIIGITPIQSMDDYLEGDGEYVVIQ